MERERERERESERARERERESEGPPNRRLHPWFFHPNFGHSHCISRVSYRSARLCVCVRVDIVIGMHKHEHTHILNKMIFAFVHIYTYACMRTHVYL